MPTMSVPQETLESTGAYRAYLPDLDTPRFQALSQQDAHEYIDEFNKLHNPPWLFALVEHWKKLLTEPLKGVTNDGASVLHVVLLVGELEADRGVPTPAFAL